MDKFEMTVKDIVEHEDGSATVTFDFDVETTKFLIQHALLDIIKKSVEATKEEQQE
jgi:ribosome biogenesis SPOUT family RNA methylase Rps3